MDKAQKQVAEAEKSAQSSISKLEEAMAMVDELKSLKTDSKWKLGLYIGLI